MAITDAVVATARIVLTEGGRLVTAAHPTIAPLLLYVARELGQSEFPKPTGVLEPKVVVYQSRLFEGVLPKETDALAEGGVGDLRWTEAALGEEPTPGRWNESLRVMRQRMLGETDPQAAIFVGGMEGIEQEYALFTAMRPGEPSYALGQPGGAAAALVEHSPEELRSDLAGLTAYPVLLRRVVEDIARRAAASPT